MEHVSIKIEGINLVLLPRLVYYSDLEANVASDRVRNSLFLLELIVGVL